MNIFYLSESPALCAEYHCDKHVVKMILETAQLLSTAHRLVDNSTDPVLYKATHYNHPCAVWVRESYANYQWTYDLLTALGREYTHRYSKIHKTITRLALTLKNPPTKLRLYRPTDRPMCMPDNCKSSDGNVLESYRRYYRTKSFAKWTKRQPPFWWQGDLK